MLKFNFNIYFLLLFNHDVLPDIRWLILIGLHDNHLNRLILFLLLGRFIDRLYLLFLLFLLGISGRLWRIHFDYDLFACLPVFKTGHFSSAVWSRLCACSKSNPGTCDFITNPDFLEGLGGVRTHKVKRFLRCVNQRCKLILCVTRLWQFS
jgi:hypothetical protein